MHSMNQLDACCQYCNANGLTEHRVAYRIGESNTDKLMEVIQDLIRNTDKSSRPTELVTYDLTRISINPTECREFCAALEELGITLHLVTGMDVPEHKEKSLKSTKQTKKAAASKKQSPSKSSVNSKKTKKSTHATPKKRVRSKTKAK